MCLVAEFESQARLLFIVYILQIYSLQWVIILYVRTVYFQVAASSFLSALGYRFVYVFKQTVDSSYEQLLFFFF